jgi:uncharacterized membrane protein HdeD (DUF308 family)
MAMTVRTTQLGGAASRSAAAQRENQIKPGESKMTSASSNIVNMPSNVRDVIRAHWKLLTFQGSAMVILGICAVAAPVLATVAVDIYVGWLFLLSGVFGLVAMFSMGSVSSFLWTFISAALAVVVGVLLIWKPIEGAYSLTFLLTAFFVAEGIFQIAASLGYRDIMPNSWGWMLASGISDLLLAAVIIWAWPTSAVWMLGLIVGVNLITSGVATVVTALSVRDAAN